MPRRSLQCIIWAGRKDKFSWNAGVNSGVEMLYLANDLGQCMLTLFQLSNSIVWLSMGTKILSSGFSFVLGYLSLEWSSTMVWIS